MSAAKHTPGPWTFGYYGCNGYCIQGGGQHIATSILYKKDGGEANARLIATAPELLEALRRLEVAANTVAYCHDKHRGNFAAALSDMESEAEAARAAIAKAEVQS